jgi:putative ABC transport system substrate-binding protein
VPTVYDRREYAAAGGLMSYGASIIEQYRQGGVYVGKLSVAQYPPTFR